MKSNKETFKFMEKFLSQDGISGHEKDISKVFINELKKTDAKLSRDGLGSVIAKFGTKGPKIMIAAHMDEVGFVVQRIEKNGFLRISPLGGHWPHTILGNKVKVINTKGKEFLGVIGSTSVHVLPLEQARKVMKIADMYVDLGFDSQEEILKAGIDVGDQVIRVSDVTLLTKGDKFMAKACDNRFGLAIAAQVALRLNKQNLNSQVYIVGSSQEEVGLRGAQASTSKIEPDIGIALDTTVSHDTPGIIPGDTQLGKGVPITMKNNSAISNPVLANQIYDLAKEKKIPTYKFVSQGGGNDSGVLQFGKGGVPVVSVAIPTRYLHTSYEIGSIKDFNSIVELLVAFLLQFSEKDYQKIIYKI